MKLPWGEILASAVICIAMQERFQYSCSHLPVNSWGEHYLNHRHHSMHSSGMQA